MTQKYFHAEYYTNLYRLATMLTEKGFVEDKPNIIFSNCLSLVAGLSFNAIKLTNKDIHIVHEWNEQTKRLINNNTIVLVVIDLETFKSININENEWMFYFEYKGKEENILLCTK